jgi:phage terminase large subunit-like protein
VAETPDEKHKAARNAYYDQHARDPDAKRFYNSAAWKRARKAKLAQYPVCQRCEKVFAEHVHHVIPLKDCTDAQKLDPGNLFSTCAPCHNIMEAQTQSAAALTVSGTLVVAEDENYFYDAEAAEKPVRFIETYCRHYEGLFAGQPFTLLDWQKSIIRTLFGWKHRGTGLRRFRELWLLTAKGAGKTPMLAAIALFMLLGDGEAGAHVVSMASSFEQANLTFDAGKKYIAQNPKLSKACESQQFVIKGPKFGKWTTISGKPNGRSGPRPSCIIADEVHEWPTGTDKAYDLLTANLFKRSQPLLLVATNAGADRTGFAWQLHERAMNVLSGKVTDDTLLPVIYEADKSLDWRSEEAAKAANPSLGGFVRFEQLQPEQLKGEARYRRLYLSQWVTGSDKAFDMELWDSCAADLDHGKLKALPLYVGIDASAGDDLFAVTHVWVTPERHYVDAHFFLPKVTAQKYEDSHRIPFTRWAEQGHITLLDEPTINHAVRQRIAAEIIATSKVNPVLKLGYDRAWKADEVVATVAAAGIECEPIGQGWGVWEGSRELDNRLKEKAVTVSRNPVLRWCAENTEWEHGKHGGFWPVKPNAKGSYAGRRSAKIDGISALVTCLTEARKHAFPKTQQQWRGTIHFA